MRPTAAAAAAVISARRSFVDETQLPHYYATLIQAAYRGYRVRSYEAKLRTMERGACELTHYLLFVLMFSVVITVQRNPSESFSLEKSLADRIDAVSFGEDSRNWEQVFTIADVWNWARALAAELQAPPDPAEAMVDENPLGANSTLAARLAAVVPMPVEFVLRGLPEDCVPFVWSERIGVYIMNELRAGNTTIAGLSGISPEQWIAMFVQHGEIAATTTGGFLNPHSRYVGGMLVSVERRESIACADNPYPFLVNTCYADEVFTAPFTGVMTGELYTTMGDTGQFITGVDIGVYGIPPLYSMCTLWQLQFDEVLSGASRSTSFMVAVYNAQARSFAFGEVIFELERGGRIAPRLDVTSAVLKHTNSTPRGVLRFALELCFLCWYVLFSARLGRTALRQGRAFFDDGWNLIDLGSHLVLLFNIIMWIVYLREAGSVKLQNTQAFSEARVGALMAEFFAVRNVSRMYAWYTAGNVISLLLSLVRIFKLLRFHERLALVTTTVMEAGTEMAHFLFIYSIVVVFYSVIGVQLFGRQLPGFVTFLDAVQSVAVIALNEFDTEPLFAVEPLLGPVFFWSFLILVTILLMNILLSILVDAFVRVKTASRSAESLLNFLEVVWQRRVRRWRASAALSPKERQRARLAATRYKLGSVGSVRRLITVKEAELQARKSRRDAGHDAGDLPQGDPASVAPGPEVAPPDRPLSDDAARPPGPPGPPSRVAGITTPPLDAAPAQPHAAGATVAVGEDASARAGSGAPLAHYAAAAANDRLVSVAQLSQVDSMAGSGTRERDVPSARFLQHPLYAGAARSRAAARARDGAARAPQGFASDLQAQLLRELRIALREDVRLAVAAALAGDPLPLSRPGSEQVGRAEQSHARAASAAPSRDRDAAEHDRSESTSLSVQEVADR